MFHQKNVTETKTPGKELNDYIVKHLVQTPGSFSVILKVKDISSVYLSNLDEVKKCLQTGYQALKRQMSATLACYLDFGEWLDLAFDLYELHRLANKQEEVVKTWKDWLRINVGICDRYARQLREISKLLAKYPKFRSLAIPFSQLWRIGRGIDFMLKYDRTIATFWAQS